jgi:hypothetical protein
VITVGRDRGRRLVAGAALAAAALLAAGCGGGDETSGADTSPTTNGAAQATDGPITVHGWVVPVGGDLRLCTTRADTEPPGCGDPSILLSGYAGTISAVEETDVVGTLENGLLVFDPQSLLDLGNAG